jgi:hypothetical protein
MERRVIRWPIFDAYNGAILDHLQLQTLLRVQALSVCFMIGSHMPPYSAIAHVSESGINSALSGYGQLQAQLDQNLRKTSPSEVVTSLAVRCSPLDTRTFWKKCEQLTRISASPASRNP